jgi:hypothetical protein
MKRPLSLYRANVEYLFLVEYIVKHVRTLEIIYALHSFKISFQFWCTSFALKGKSLFLQNNVQKFSLGQMFLEKKNESGSICHVI